MLSEYGTRIAVSRNADGSARARRRLHSGVDIRAHSIGDPVIASADGFVVRVKFDEVVGGSITVAHEPHGQWTRYLHLKQGGLEPGQRVHRGDVIGEVGLFPYSGGVIHVHWMLCTNSSCSGPGDLGGTSDPMKLNAGCFNREKEYQGSHLVLTYPVPCD